ncbi:MAG: hypothetical protein JNG89_11215 [Planctomycetaceae bacterium]|nr:hypothetical protein [Planctomycetaceae bacterium]
MAISVACPACGRQYSVKDDAGGKRFKCKTCETVIDVPEGGDEFAADDYGDPYGGDLGAAPAPAPARRKSGGGSSAGSAAAAAQTLVPAIFMYVICGLSILYMLVQIVGTAAGVLNPEEKDVAFMVGFYGASCAFLVRDVFLIYAFSRMQALKSFGVAYAGAIISVIPVLGAPCCVLGIPFGIWALVVLNNPSVKSAFR